MPHSYTSLRQQRLTTATRPFNARGKLLKRCQQCQLAEYLCACEWRVTRESALDFVILFHRNEILKPTNTGRLIAQVFPQSTFCFCWSRTEPEQALLDILQDPNRACMVLYPEELTSSLRQVYTEIPKFNNKKITLIVLDGTWKQARRMMTLSSYLNKIPALHLNFTEQGEYGLRKALIEGQLATAEAVAATVCQFGEQLNGQVLQDSFDIFNQRYAASRLCQNVPETPAQQRLKLLIESN
jgi:DTW domain-containing protein YfiP